MSLFNISWPFCADNAPADLSFRPWIGFLWVLLYRIWPQVIDAMVLVKPATVLEWHRKGFRFYWRGRSRRPGRPKISPNIRDLIRRMSNANPLLKAALPKIAIPMREVGDRFQDMYFAAKDGNWALAAYMSKYMNGAMNPAKLTKPNEYKVWASFYESTFAPVTKAIEGRIGKALNLPIRQ